MNIHSPRFIRRPLRPLLTASLLSFVGLLGIHRAQSQTLFFEDFEGLPLGPNREEALAGTSVFTATAPSGWLSDNTGVPGVGTALDGVVEWAGWGFANKDWWVSTAGDQRRSEFNLGIGTVMIADPDEWDDAGHPQGLYNVFISTPVIPLSAVEANSLVIAFDSTWRPEGFDDGLPNFPVDEEGRPINNQTAFVRSTFSDGATNVVLHWNSDSTSEFFKADGEFINEAVLLPLNNAAGASSLKLTFSLEISANDWWWAVDNITVGQPPLMVGLSANGIQFAARIAEGLGRTVDQTKGITVLLDGVAVAPVTVSAEGTVITVTYSQDPKVWTPKSVHTVKITYTSSLGKLIEETRTFIAPSYTTASATPTSVTATIVEPEYFTIAEGQGVTLKLDGASVATTSVVRTDKQIVVRHNATTAFVPNSAHVLELTFKTTAGTEVVETINFNAPDYKTLPATLATAVGTGAGAGLKWRTHQISTNRPSNTISATEAQLRGELGPNIAVASSEADGFFNVDFVNFDQTAGDAGNFKSSAEIATLQVADGEIPGIPGTEDGTDNVATEAWTFVEIPQAGIYTMVVNSDDGFQVSVGTTNQPTALVLGSFDAGRGASDTAFYFQVTQPGVYFFRLLYFEGGGGASVEWFTVNADGSYALVNGSQAGALKGFRSRTVPEPVVGGTIESVSFVDGKVVISYTGTLKGSATLGGTFETVTGATSPYSVTPPAGAGQQFYRAE